RTILTADSTIISASRRITAKPRNSRPDAMTLLPLSLMDHCPGDSCNLAPQRALCLIATRDIDHNPDHRAAEIRPLLANGRHIIFLENRSDDWHDRFIFAFNV